MSSIIGSHPLKVLSYLILALSFSSSLANLCFLELLRNLKSALPHIVSPTCILVYVIDLSGYEKCDHICTEQHCSFG